MDYQFGDIIKEKRIEHGYTQQELADKIGYTRALLSKVEQSKRNPSYELLLELSYLLTFDFVTMYKNIGNYKSFKHYKLFHELVRAVEQRNIKKVSELINNKIVKDEFTYGETYIMREYCKSLVYLEIDNDINKTHELCLNVLNIDESAVKDHRIKLNQPYNYYSLYMTYERCLLSKNDTATEFELLETLIRFLEKNYFNSIIPLTSIDYFYKKFYIIVLNNLADINFREKNYEQSIVICDKAIEKSKELNVLNILYDIIMLKSETLFMMGAEEKARILYSQLVNFCILTNNNDFLERETNRLKQEYPKFLA